MSEPFDDFRLVKECIAGQKTAWDLFVDRFSKLVTHSINRTLISKSRDLPKDDVADLHNSIFLSFIENSYKKLRQFEGKNRCTLASWVRLISVRHTLDFLKKQKQHISLDEESGEAGPLIDKIPDQQMSVEERMALRENERMIQEAINELPVSDQLFMKLYYEKEIPPETIARIMGFSVNTIYSKKTRIRGKIKKILKKKGCLARDEEQTRLFE